MYEEKIVYSETELKLLGLEVDAELKHLKVLLKAYMRCAEEIDKQKKAPPKQGFLSRL